MPSARSSSRELDELRGEAVGWVRRRAGSPSFTPTRSATTSRSVRCLTMTDIVSRNVCSSMSCAPSSSSARAQSIDSAIDGGFLRSRSRTIPMTSTSLRATCSSSSGACRRTISSSCSSVGVVEPEVQAAALERLGQLARVVRGQQHDGLRARLDAAELGDRDLEVATGPRAASPRTPGRSCRSRRSAGRPARARRSRSSAGARAGTPRRRCRPGPPPSRCPCASAWMRSSCLR